MMMMMMLTMMILLRLPQAVRCMVYCAIDKKHLGRQVLYCKKAASPSAIHFLVNSCVLPYHAMPCQRTPHPLSARCHPPSCSPRPLACCCSACLDGRPVAPLPAGAGAGRHRRPAHTGRHHHRPHTSLGTRNPAGRDRKARQGKARLPSAARQRPCRGAAGLPSGLRCVQMH